MPLKSPERWPPDTRGASPDDWTQTPLSEVPAVLVRALLSAYQQRLTEDYPDDDPADVTLFGECHLNAPVVARQVVAHGLVPWLTWGVVVPWEEGAEYPATVPEAEETHRGSVHFWIEVLHEGERYVLDLSSERGAERGYPRVYRHRPPEYHVPAGGLIRATEPIHSRSLRGIEGYRNLKREREM